ncbi:MAG: glycosyltransferase [Planctomycetota bacterium]
MSCSVVIPCHDGVELTRLCLESLLAQESPPAEILIVDNGSQDATSTLGDFDPRVAVIRLDQNLGFAGGVNAGLRRATSEEVLVCNNDTQAAPGMLAELQRVLRSSSDIGAAAPVSNHVKGEAHLPTCSDTRGAKAREEIATALRQSAPPLQDVEILAGLCLLLRRSTLQEVSGFDERFGHGNFEDDDLSLRLRLRGYRLVLARRAFLHHEGHATFRHLGIDLNAELQQRAAQFREKWRTRPAGLAMLANMYGQDALAARAAEQALRSSPRWLDAHWLLGRFYQRRGRAEQAIRHLRTFLATCPEHVGAQVHLGLALRAAGRQAQGKQLLGYVTGRHALIPSLHAELLLRLGQFELEEQSFGSARELLRESLELQNDDGEAWNLLGLCELERHDDQAAESAFAKAVEHEHAIANTNLGICQHRRGDLHGAHRSFERAVVLLPEDRAARSNYEASAAALGRTAAAIDARAQAT